MSGSHLRLLHCTAAHPTARRPGLPEQRHRRGDKYLTVDRFHIVQNLAARGSRSEGSAAAAPCGPTMHRPTPLACAGTHTDGGPNPPAPLPAPPSPPSQQNPRREIAGRTARGAATSAATNEMQKSHSHLSLKACLDDRQARQAKLASIQASPITPLPCRGSTLTSETQLTPKDEWQIILDKHQISPITPFIRHATKYHIKYRGCGCDKCRRHLPQCTIPIHTRANLEPNSEADTESDLEYRSVREGSHHSHTERPQSPLRPRQLDFDGLPLTPPRGGPGSAADGLCHRHSPASGVRVPHANAISQKARITHHLFPKGRNPKRGLRSTAAMDRRRIPLQELRDRRKSAQHTKAF